MFQYDNVSIGYKLILMCRIECVLYIYGKFQLIATAYPHE